MYDPNKNEGKKYLLIVGILKGVYLQDVIHELISRGQNFTSLGKQEILKGINHSYQLK